MAERLQRHFAAAAALALLLGRADYAEAMTGINGNLFFENTAAEGPEDSPNLLQGGVNLDLYSPARNYQARLGFRFDHMSSEQKTLLTLNPIGNLGIDFNGEMYSLNLQHSRFATISSAAELTEMRVSRAGLSFFPKDLPRLVTSFSRAESISDGVTGANDTASVFGDYRYEWLNFRGGYSADTRTAGERAGQKSSAALLGLGGSYEILPQTTLSGDFDYNRFSSKAAALAATTTTGRALRLSADSRPTLWLGLAGNFAHTLTDTDSPDASVPTIRRQFADATASIQPYAFLRLSGTLGNRRFNDAAAMRSVDYTTLAANFNQQVRQGILLGLSGSRSFESDPGQGKNTSDNVGVNSALDVIPGVAMRLGLNVNRSEVRAFVSTAGYDATGTLADRALFDDRPPGFTFFDTVNNDLYTKKSAAAGDWVLSAHAEPMTARYFVSRSVQVNASPTDKTSLALSYSASSSTERLDIGQFRSQSLNASLTYAANRRTSYGVSGTASLPERGRSAYSITATMAYRFLRGHQLSLNYGLQRFAARRDQTFAGTLSFALRKHLSLEVIASATRLLTKKQVGFFRVRLSKSF